jgi:hypothetical protein
MQDSEDITENGLPDDLSRFEGQLAALAAESPSIDRDELMFAAGRAAASGGIVRWAWPLAIAASSAAAVVMAVMLVGSQTVPSDVARGALNEPAEITPTPTAPERTDATRKPVVRTRPVSMLGRDHLGRRQWALAHGGDALTSFTDIRTEQTGVTDNPPVTMRELLEELTSNPKFARKPT